MAKTFGKKGFNIFRDEGALWVVLDYDPDTATFEFGDYVALDSNGKAVKVTNLAATDVGGFVYNDSDEYNAIAAKKVKVYVKNFAATTDKYNATATYAPGTDLTVKNGVVDVAVTGDVVIGKALGAPVNGILKFIVA